MQETQLISLDREVATTKVPKPQLAHQKTLPAMPCYSSDNVLEPLQIPFPEPIKTQLQLKNSVCNIK